LPSGGSAMIPDSRLSPAPYPVEVSNPLLRTMFIEGRVLTPDGERVRYHSQVSRWEANALYETILARKPPVVVEIGMAFGTTTLAILSAMEEMDHGRLISIDPGQHGTEWRGTGMANVARCGFDHRHTLIEQPSYAALPRLLGDGLEVQAAYIDGWHTVE